MIALILLIVLLLSRASGLDLLSELITFKNFNESNSKNISEECRVQMNLTLSALSSYDEWAWSMVDACSKIPTGILRGNVVDLGNFDQCVAIEHRSGDTVIKGKHCAMGVVVPVRVLTNRFDTIIHVHQEHIIVSSGDLNVPRLIRRDEVVGLTLSICIPSACKATEIQEYFGLSDLQFDDAHCQTSDTPDFDGGDIAVITFLAIIALLLVVSTIYDVYLHKSQQKSLHPLLLAFSVLTNGKKFLTVTTSDNHFKCVDGLRFISRMWTVFGHRFAFYQAVPVTNGEDIIKWTNSLCSQYIQSAEVTADAFLYLCGLMMSYGYFKTIDKPKSKTYVPMLYLRRLLRVTPALAAVYFVYITFFRYLGSGPLWETMTRDPCLKWWWSYYLYVQNYVNYDDLCISPTWYLSADMQLFFISPLIVMPLGYVALRTTNAIVYSCCGLLVAAFTFIPFVINFFVESNNTIMTHERLAVWMIGVTTGIFLEDVKSKEIKVRINWMLNVLIWIVVSTGMIAILLTMHDVRHNVQRTKTNLFDRFQRVGLGIGLSWIVYSCAVGYAGFVNAFLSCRPFQILSRLSYTLLLVNSPIIMLSAMTMRDTYYFSDYNMYYQLCGDSITAILVAAAWLLAFESPMVVFEEVIFAPKVTVTVSPSKQTKGVVRSTLSKVS